MAILAAAKRQIQFGFDYSLVSGYFFYKKITFLFSLILKQAYFLSVKPPAALDAAATVREMVPLYLEARSFFKKAYGNSTIEPTGAGASDSSADMPRPGGPAPAVLPPAMTNADQPKQEPKCTNQGVIYQAKATH